MTISSSHSFNSSSSSSSNSNNSSNSSNNSNSNSNSKHSNPDTLRSKILYSKTHTPPSQPRSSSLPSTPGYLGTALPKINTGLSSRLSWKTAERGNYRATMKT